MGTSHDTMAVVDSKLNVRGVKGLRVADCSVMPTIHSGHTQMPAFGIGERAAEFILEALRVDEQSIEEHGRLDGNGKNDHVPVQARL